MGIFVAIKKLHFRRNSANERNVEHVGESFKAEQREVFCSCTFNTHRNLKVLFAELGHFQCFPFIVSVLILHADPWSIWLLLFSLCVELRTCLFTSVGNKPRASPLVKAALLLPLSLISEEHGIEGYLIMCTGMEAADPHLSEVS